MTTPVYTLKSTRSLSTKSGIGNCDQNDINIKYTLSNDMFNYLVPVVNSPIGESSLDNLFTSDSNKMTYSAEICVPSKCKNGSKPINIGKVLGLNINQLFGSDLKDSSYVDFYGCVESLENNNICRMGVQINENLCLNLPQIYPKNN